MNVVNKPFIFWALTSLFFWSGGIWAFDSGSTGADGSFAPTDSQEIELPANGIFNYTTVNIPSGVTIRYTRNAINSPVMILASGDVVIDGTVDIKGEDGAIFNLNVAGAPGGYAGGRGGLVNSAGANGLGPGGGQGGRGDLGFACGGTGGGFGIEGGFTNNGNCNNVMLVGDAYGSGFMLPLLGGSGGGGGSSIAGSVISVGGGHGGGAILIAASGELNINGAIDVQGGAGQFSSSPSAGSGGGGSGGAIRLVATSLTGGGVLRVKGGKQGSNNSNNGAVGGGGGNGRVRIETEAYNFTGTFEPAIDVSIGAPGPLFPTGLPSVRITQIDGVAVPEFPTGGLDVTLPADIINPVTVEFAATDVPLGNTLALSVTPLTGTVITVTSTPLIGDVANSTASAAVDLPQGVSVLLASVEYAVTLAMGQSLSIYAQGEQVERVKISSTPEGGSQTLLITASGKRYLWSGNAPVLMN